MLKIVLFQPEIAGNVGSIIRCCACFETELHIIEPCGFPFDLSRIKKSALDYINHVKICKHDSFKSFYKNMINQNNRLILATTKSQKDIYDFKFYPDDFILFGKESAGVPEDIHNKASARVKIMINNNHRSLNLAISCGIFLAKAKSDFK